MSLTVGAKLGPYEILASIGAGGMGEVYRARDTNLDREVAIKVLPAALAQDPERLARFKREAKVLASLNHPHIAQIYGVEDSALIMELVDGEAPRGPLPLETALHYARQIAEALEAAHEKGIVHRDLKPGNVMVTPEGVVKVLDFGLAAVAGGSAGDSNPDNSPTMTVAATHAGMIMGTAAYMSPEQASGKAVDKRADIWSFGVVLFELLTGHRLFEGETVSHTLAGVLAGPIDFDQLPRETPATIRALLRRCLDRNAKNRLRDIGEARIAIEAAFQPAEPAAPPPKPQSPFAWIAAAVVFALLFGALAFVHFREAPPQRQRVKYQIDPPAGELGGFRLSPDGRFLAIVTSEGSTTRKIWIRSLDGLETRLLTDIQGLRSFTLFWSWDGEQIAFQSGDKLYKIARIGGPPVVLADAPQPIQGGVWLDGGVILFGTASGLFRVSSSGDAPVRIDDQSAESPAWLPGGRFLYVRANGTFAGSLDGGKPVPILPDRAASTYVLPLKVGLPGHLLFVRGETLLAQPFNADKPELQGDAIPVEACAVFAAPSCRSKGTRHEERHSCRRRVARRNDSQRSAGQRPASSASFASSQRQRRRRLRVICIGERSAGRRNGASRLVSARRIQDALAGAGRPSVHLRRREHGHRSRGLQQHDSAARRRHAGLHEPDSLRAGRRDSCPPVTGPWDRSGNHACFRRPGLELAAHRGLAGLSRHLLTPSA